VGTPEAAAQPAKAVAKTAGGVHITIPTIKGPDGSYVVDVED
jgi:hypothetical protein